MITSEPSSKSVVKIPVTVSPAPTAMPMLATTKIVAALVMPMIVPRSRITTPAPRKPMPGMIWAAMRVWSPPTFDGHFVGNHGEKRGAEANQHVGADARGLVAQLALQTDNAAQERGQKQAADDIGVQIMQHGGKSLGPADSYYERGAGLYVPVGLLCGQLASDQSLNEVSLKRAARAR